MGVYGWNELLRSGSSLVTIVGTVKDANFSGTTPTDDCDWNLDVKPDDKSSIWCITDPAQLDHTNSNGLIECEVEPVLFLNPQQTMNAHQQATFDQYFGPLVDANVEITGYWARDRSHGYMDSAPNVASNYGDNGKMEIHPVVSVVATGLLPDGRDDVRVFVFTDASDQDPSRAVLEALIDAGTTGGTHVPHRGVPQSVTLEVPSPSGIPGSELAITLLEEIVNCESKQFSVDDQTGDLKFTVTTGTSSSGKGFYYFHGLLSRR